MEKEKIVARFLKEGYQIDTSALDYFTTTPEKTSEFIQKIKTTKSTPPIINLNFVKTTLKHTKPTIKIIKKFFIGRKNEKISISDYSNRFVDIYTRKKQLLMNRVDVGKLLSINKIQKQNQFVIICMVREKDPVEKSIKVEDLTGSTTVYFKEVSEFENLLENDVIAVLCDSSPNGIEARRIVWPDVPLKREAKKAKRSVYCIFVSDFHMDSKNFNKKRYEKFVGWVEKTTGKQNHVKIYIFILGGISRRSEEVKRFLDALPKETFKIFLQSSKDARVLGHLKPDDIMVSEIPITLEIEGIKFLLCQAENIHKYRNGRKNDAMGVMKDALKRRELRPCVASDQPYIPSKEFIIDHIPDIFVSGGFHFPQTTNHKGITLITTGDLADNPIFWGVELKSREINKLDLS